MLIFIVKRIGFMALTMLLVSAVLFALLETGLTGDVATRVLGPYVSEEQRALWREQHGYDRALHVRYADWLAGFLRADFGESVRFKAPVSEILWPRLWNTVILGAWTLAIMVPLALLLGVLAGMREGSKLDRSVTVVSVITTSIPEIATAIILTVVLALGLGWLPAKSAMNQGFDGWKLVLPVLTLVIYDFGYVARMTRASMAEVMTSHYIRTAVLKGIPRSRVIMRHALRNALIAPFTVIVLQLNWLLSGVVVVEVFFEYDGFGRMLLQAALFGDVYVIQAATLVAVFVAVFSQIISDVGYTFLNPRIRFA